MQLWLGTALAGNLIDNPLEPIDTSSPRSTLIGFLTYSNEAYKSGVGKLSGYMASNQLYLTPEQEASVLLTTDRMRLAGRAIDFSELPPAMFDDSSRRLTIQLKDVLDHIDIPAVDSIPDAKAMNDLPFKHWTIPGTEIRISQIENGPRAGEYLFDKETVRNIPYFFERVKDLPYKNESTPGWYEAHVYTPVGLAFGLDRIIPPRYILNVPHWMVAIRFLDQPLWRWICIIILLGLGALVVRFFFWFSNHFARGVSRMGRSWLNILKPLSLVIVTPITVSILGKVLRITGGVYDAFTFSLWGLFILSVAWAVWMTMGALAETAISTERLRQSSIDSQLIRLMVRLFTIIIIVVVLVVGGDRIGLPAYSVVAGLGVSGLAVALAAQQTLANLMGSLIIMFEKPFGIGNSIKVEGIEGRVENVGFRSTQIRTLDNSLVTIPSSHLVSTTIENLNKRNFRRVLSKLKLNSDTPRADIEALIWETKSIILDNELVNHEDMQVVLYEFGNGGPDILIDFFIKVADDNAELEARHDIFMKLLAAAEALNIKLRYVK